MTVGPARRLRFSYNPAADESVVGAFVAACHDQRLRSVASALEGGGIHLSRPGHIQIADQEVLAAAACVMRSDPAKLSTLSFRPSGQRDVIMLGDLAFSRKAIALDRRRIAPGSLVNQPYHQAAWLNRLLPYCPSSLELLVDACPSCGPLGWRHTRGIAYCEICGMPVPPSKEAPLLPEFIEDYRRLARLLSRDEATGLKAVQELSEPLRRFTRTAVVDVLIRVGLTVVGARSRAAISALINLPPAEIANALCAGIRYLCDWPNAIQRFVDERTAAIRDNVSDYQQLRDGLRWIARGTEEGSQIMSLPFPTLDGRTSGPFSKESHYYTATEVNTLLWTSSRELNRIREAGAIRCETLPSRKRLRARYNVEDVSALRRLLRDSVTPSAAAVRLDVPVYAIEQFADLGLLGVNDQAGVVALRGAQIVARTIDDLLHRLVEGATRSPAPIQYLTLKKALSLYPGEKPWGRAVAAVLEGRVPFHLAGDKLELGSALVDPASFSSLGEYEAGRSEAKLGITHLSLRDALEILCAPHEEGSAVIEAAGLAVVPYGKGKGVSRSALRDLVAEVAFTGEAAAWTGRSGIALHHEFIRAGVPRVHGAWSRRVLEGLEMVNSDDRSYSSSSPST